MKLNNINYTMIKKRYYVFNRLINKNTNSFNCCIQNSFQLFCLFKADISFAFLKKTKPI